MGNTSWRREQYQLENQPVFTFRILLFSLDFINDISGLYSSADIKSLEPVESSAFPIKQTASISARYTYVAADAIDVYNIAESDSK